MVISKGFKALVAAFRRPPVQSDRELDHWIQDALFEDALAQPPVGAWERLYKAIADRGMARRSHGMWVLDEPLRDPPESPPMVLSGYQFKRALRLYDDTRRNPGQEVREMLWNNMMPTFITLISL